jgi:hypothetical protein
VTLDHHDVPHWLANDVHDLWAIVLNRYTIADQPYLPWWQH